MRAPTIAIALAVTACSAVTDTGSVVRTCEQAIGLVDGGHGCLAGCAPDVVCDFAGCRGPGCVDVFCRDGRLVIYQSECTDTGAPLDAGATDARIDAPETD